MDQNITYQQFEKVFQSIKGGKRFSKVSIRTLSDAIITDFEIDDSHKPTVDSAVKRFIRKRENVINKKLMLAQDELEEVFLELDVPEENKNGEDDLDEDKCYRLSLLTVSKTSRLN